MPRHLVSFVLAAALVTAGCSDSSDGANDSRKLSEVSASEAESLCKSFLSSVSDAEWNDIARFVCAFAELLQPQCSDARIDSCASSTAAQIKVNPAQCEQVSDSETDLGACDVTVGELRTCLDDIWASLAAIGHDASCATLSSAGSIDWAPPASCKALQDRCPGLLD